MDQASEMQRQATNQIRFGTVAEVDLGLGRCRVQSGELRTDWLPWFVPRAGDAIEWSAPTIGEQGIVLAPEGDTHGAVFMRGLYSDRFPAPSSSGSSHLVRYPDGAEVEYDHEAHSLKATLPGGGTVEVTADGGVTINGPLTVNGDAKINGDTQVDGDVDVSGTATADVDVLGGGKSLKSHIHTGVLTGGAVSGPPQ